MHPDGYLARVLRGDLPPPPIALHLGWRFLDYDSVRSILKVRMESKPEFLNPMGKVHGGMLAAMLDELMAPTLAATLGPDEFGPTIEMKVSFISAANAGPIFGIGQVVARKSTIAFVEGRLEDESGCLIARASATFKVGQMREGKRPADQ
jgi:uncharacterized protein (TIGR00369 family)